MCNCMKSIRMYQFQPFLMTNLGSEFAAHSPIQKVLLYISPIRKVNINYLKNITPLDLSQYIFSLIHRSSKNLPYSLE